MSSNAKFWGNPLDLLGKLMADVIDLQARMQEFEDRERLETPCTRIAVLEARNTDLIRRVSRLEEQRPATGAAKETTKRA